MMSDELQAGRELDALVAERIFGWMRVQPPKHDFDGPLPGQGEVLASPTAVPMIESGEYAWPPKGIIPFTFFLPSQGWSTDISAAWQVIERMAARGLWLTLLTPYDATDGYHATFTPHGRPQWCDAVARAQAATAPLAICRAALRAVEQTAACAA